MAASQNIVLVHGAWADGSCWSNVIERLQADGYKRRHQKHLLTINRNEVLTHNQNPPDPTGQHPPFSRQPREKRKPTTDRTGGS